MNKVLILGAGLVARPIARHLLKQGVHVTIASRTLSKAEEILAGHPNGSAVAWSVVDTDALDQMVSTHDVVVSLLPYVHHLMVAHSCITHSKNMVTTSYIKPEMMALDEEAKKANIVILNEVGLDPGIDHMSAQRVIDGVHEKGGKVEEFYSLCGALPDPETAKSNPFGYKFSWSPKGVVMAGNNDAKFLVDGLQKYIPTADLFKNPVKLNFSGIGDLEVYPNRDSISYIEVYQIPEAKTVFRGTIRYPGWSNILDAIKRMHLITYDKISMKGKTYSDIVLYLINAKDQKDVREAAASYLNISITDPVLDALEWLGLFDNKPVNREEDSPFELTSDLMIDKMWLGLNEKDMVVMQHTFLASWPDGRKEVIRSRMLDFGTPATDTSVARTVALPAAIAVLMILQGKIKVKGVHRPVIPDIYNPILDELEKLNIKMTEEFGLPLREKFALNK